MKYSNKKLFVILQKNYNSFSSFYTDKDDAYYFIYKGNS